VYLKKISLFIGFNIYIKSFNNKTKHSNKTISFSSCSLRSSYYLQSHLLPCKTRSQIKKQTQTNNRVNYLYKKFWYNLNFKLISIIHQFSYDFSNHQVSITFIKFIFHMLDFYRRLTTHRHLTLLPEDSCIEISIQRPEPVILLLWTHTAMHIIISIFHHLIIFIWHSISFPENTTSWSHFNLITYII